MAQTYKPVKLLSEQTAKKIAAGEVIERPSSVVRELLDNALDANASKITVALISGGVSEITVIDDGFGMSEQDLKLCTETHSTSKISTIEDLLEVTSLGFRGEALASIKAVSDLEIISTQNGPVAYKFFDEAVSKTTYAKGTKVTVKNLFYNFPARKKFLKNSSTETKMCKTVFVEKALAHPNVEMTFKNDDKVILHLPAETSYKARVAKALSLSAESFTETDAHLFEVYTQGETFSASIVLGPPEFSKPTRSFMYIFANGRRIDEYALIQALDYGAAPFFPNGTHPVALAFLTLKSETVDFNIHPAKREAKFLDLQRIHHAISTCVSNFYKSHTVATLKKNFNQSLPETILPLDLPESNSNHLDSNFENRVFYERSRMRSFESNSRAENFQGSYQTTPSSNELSRFSVAESLAHYSTLKNSFAQAESAACFNGAKSVDELPKDFRFLGQVAKTFLAIEKNNDLYLIDQHAAHERILYEALKQRSSERQELLVPYRLETESAEQDTMLENYKAELFAQGFELEKIADSVWSVNSVPILWRGNEADLNEDIKKALFSNLNVLDEILALSACRAACKKGDILSPDFAYDLAKKTFALPEPLCPHGRPLWVLITCEELFRRIKR